MPQLGETAAVALAAEVAVECPFPHKEDKRNLANDFSNNAGTLGTNLTGGDDRTITMEVRGEKKSMDLGLQAHHLIPGAAIKGASALRKYMTAGQTVKEDIGYLQNEVWNGAWLPALHKYKGWGQLSKTGGYEIQFAYAYAAMKATGGQFHMWDSSHADYNAFVRRTLEEIRLKMLSVRSVCEKCDNSEKKPWDTPFPLLGMVNAVAGRMREHVTGPTSKWKPPYCTSDFAVLVGAGYTPDTMEGL